MSPRRTLSLVCWVVVVLIWIVAIQEWQNLPHKFPMHFDWAGKPDSFVDKSIVAWFLLPAFSTMLNLGLSLLLPMVRWMAIKHPEFVNMPRKEQWLQLDLPARLRTLEPVCGALQGLQLSIIALFLFIVIGCAKVASGQWTLLPIWPMFVFLATISASVAWLMFRSYTVVQKEFNVFQDSR